MSKRKETGDVMSRLQGMRKQSQPAPERQDTPTRSTPPPPSPKREPAEPARKTPKKRLQGRVTYDIGPDLKEVIREEATRLGVPASQLAKYLLLYAWDDYVEEQIPPPPLLASDSPAYRNVIDFAFE